MGQREIVGDLGGAADRGRTGAKERGGLLPEKDHFKKGDQRGRV